MNDIDDGLPAKAWSAMTVEERDAAFLTLSTVVKLMVDRMIDDVNEELVARGCPLRLRGSLSVKWEDEGSAIT
jgi:hypothetical protein